MNNRSANNLFTQINVGDRPIVLLINIIMRHQQPQFAVARQYLPTLQCLLSAENEDHRDYAADFSSLDVTIQKSLCICSSYRHRAGFSDRSHIYLPYDTYPQLRRRKPAAIVSYELGFRSLASSIYARTRRGVPLTVVLNESEHTAAGWGLLRRMTRPMILKAASFVTYNGTSSENYLREMKVPQHKLRHLPYTAHPGMINCGPTTRSHAQRHRLLYVGQLSDRKNVLEFLRQLSRWCRANPERLVDFSIVGRGPLSSKISEHAAPQNLHLKLYGSIDPKEMPGIYAEHGILVFPTLADEWGMVTNEAMHSGLPVLGSIFAQSVVDLIKPTENGWAFRGNNDDATYQAIAQALNTPPETINEMAARARADIAHCTPQWSGKLLAQAAIAGLL